MDPLMIVLRLIHVLAGVFWAGATFVLASHVNPAVKATGPEGAKFMQQFAAKSSLSAWLGAAATLTLLSGLIMYFLQGWQTMYMTGAGTVLGLGIVVGVGAYFHGLFVQRKAITRMQSLGSQIGPGGPTAAQAAQVGQLSAKIERNGQVLAYLLAATVVLMGIFQYF